MAQTTGKPPFSIEANLHSDDDEILINTYGTSRTTVILFDYIELINRLINDQIQFSRGRVSAKVMLIATY